MRQNTNSTSKQHYQNYLESLMRKKAIEAARDIFQDHPLVIILDDAKIQVPSNQEGAYVEAWVWVSLHEIDPEAREQDLESLKLPPKKKRSR